MKRLVLDDIHGRTLVTPLGFVLDLGAPGQVGLTMSLGVPVRVAVSELVSACVVDDDPEVMKAERHRLTAYNPDNGGTT